MPRVVYIAGYGRSGSTLLDMLLGSHPQAFGAGELTEVFDEWRAGGACSCGQPYDRCELWSRVRARVEIALPGLTLAAMARITRRAEAALTPWGLNQRHPDSDVYGQLWRTLLEAIEHENGTSVIVDSSKSSRGTGRRPLALARLAGLDVKVIHLVRDPRAVMWSAFRGSNRKIEAGAQNVGLRGGLYRLLIGWSLANTSVHLMTGGRRLSVKRLRYEDLVAQPARLLRELGRFLDLDLEPVIAAVSEQRPFEAGHGVGGNRMRRQGPVRIKADEEWRSALPRRARWLAALAWPWAGRYGYNVFKSEATRLAAELQEIRS